MNGHDQDKLEGVLDRRFHFSGTDELFQRCSGCNRFLARCSGIHPRVTHETGTQLSLQVPPVCHHWPVVLVDGVVVEAGTTEARGGIGYVYGTGAEDQESLRVDTEGFGFGVPTAQKVELLAAILALRNFEQREPDETTCAMDQGDNFNGGAEIVVASNSEYLTRGITEWFPSWRRNGFKSAVGTTPANLDMFCLLDETISRLEDRGVAVGFVISRELNIGTRVLARNGANRL